jgi:hypothetical protein
MRFVSTERDSTQQSILGKWVLHELVRVLHSSEGRQTCLELGLEVRIIQNSKRTGRYIIDYAFLHSQKEGFALIHEYLGNILIHDNGTLNRIL